MYAYRRGQFAKSSLFSWAQDSFPTPLELSLKRCTTSIRETDNCQGLTTVRQETIYTPCHLLECQAMCPLPTLFAEAEHQAPPKKLPISAANHSPCSHPHFQVDLHEVSWPYLVRIFYGKEGRYRGSRRTSICVIYIVMRFASVIGVTYARAAEYMTTGDGMRSLSYCLPRIRFQADIATAWGM